MVFFLLNTLESFCNAAVFPILKGSIHTRSRTQLGFSEEDQHSKADEARPGMMRMGNLGLNPNAALAAPTER